MTSKSDVTPSAIAILGVEREGSGDTWDLPLTS